MLLVFYSQWSMDLFTLSLASSYRESSMLFSTSQAAIQALWKEEGMMPMLPVLLFFYLLLELLYSSLSEIFLPML